LLEARGVVFPPPHARRERGPARGPRRRHVGSRSCVATLAAIDLTCSVAEQRGSF